MSSTVYREKNFCQSVQLPNRYNKRLLSLREFQQGNSHLHALSRVGPLVAYGHAGPLGKEIVCTDGEGNRYILQTPRRAVGMPDVLLAVEHRILSPGRPSFDLQARRGQNIYGSRDFDVLYRTETMDILEYFPNRNGDYVIDARHGISLDYAVGADASSEPYHLWRTPHGEPFIGLPVVESHPLQPALRFDVHLAWPHEKLLNLTATRD